MILRRNFIVEDPTECTSEGVGVGARSRLRSRLHFPCPICAHDPLYPWWITGTQIPVFIGTPLAVSTA
jgi:hypothetical protein